MSEPTIRKMIPEDLNQVSKIHKLAFDKAHFTSRFSDKMLQSFYQELLNINEFCFVALDEQDNVVGFIVSGYKTGIAVKNFSKTNSSYIVITLLLNPEFLIGKLLAFLTMFVKKNVNNSSAKFRLLSIAISPEAQGKGVSKKLIDFFENHLINNNIYLYGLSVKKGNNRAIKFYEKNNFKMEYEKKDGLSFVKTLK